MISIAVLSNGHTRWALNALETIMTSLPIGSETKVDDFDKFSDERTLRYNAGQDENYDIVSAHIKSICGCDSDMGIFWLTKMLDSGDDSRFIARRMVIFTSEYIGLMDSNALRLAIICFEACAKVGCQNVHSILHMLHDFSPQHRKVTLYTQRYQNTERTWHKMGCKMFPSGC
jgi:putative ATPase